MCKMEDSWFEAAETPISDEESRLLQEMKQIAKTNNTSKFKRDTVDIDNILNKDYIIPCLRVSALAPA